MGPTEQGSDAVTVVSHSRSFIFVSQRKAASTSITAALSPLCADDDVIVNLASGERYAPEHDDDDFGSIQPRNAMVFRDVLPMNRNGPGSGHILPGNIRKTVGGRVWDEYFKFAVVRNPWDWFVSLYCWKLGGNWPQQGRSHHYSLRGYLRSRYRLYRALPNYALGRHRANVESILKRGWFAAFISDMPAFYFLDGRPCSDYYIRFENLQQGYDEVCRQMGFPRRPLPRTKNRVRDGNREYREYYTDWSREYIAQQCRPVIDDFDYRF